MWKRLGIDHRRTTAYHPQSNGLTEWYNQILINCTVKYTDEKEKDVDQCNAHQTLQGPSKEGSTCHKMISAKSLDIKQPFAAGTTKNH
ncbi:hypothetical protein LSAT2_012248 [Lamellibrachia satsuma]|nr:hypothetical protein LSAT2_012248 [Lamellibrachia satsuma]